MKINQWLALSSVVIACLLSNAVFAASFVSIKPQGLIPCFAVNDTELVTYRVTNISGILLQGLVITPPDGATIASTTCGSQLGVGQLCDVTLLVQAPKVPGPFVIGSISVFVFNGTVCAKAVPEDLITAVAKPLVNDLVTFTVLNDHQALTAICAENIGSDVDLTKVQINGLGNRVTQCATTASTFPYYIVTGDAPPTQSPAYCGIDSEIQVGDTLLAAQTKCIRFRAQDIKTVQGNATGSIDIQFTSSNAIQRVKVTVTYARNLYAGGNSITTRVGGGGETTIAKLVNTGSANQSWQPIVGFGAGTIDDEELAPSEFGVNDIILDSFGDVIIAAEEAGPSIYRVAKLDVVNHTWANVTADDDTRITAGGNNALIVDNNGDLITAGGFTNVTLHRIGRLNKNTMMWERIVLGNGAGEDEGEFTDTLLAMTIDANGLLVVGGRFVGIDTNKVARLNVGGTAWEEITTLLNDQAVLSVGAEPINSLIVDSDGLLVAAGEVPENMMGMRDRIVKTNADSTNWVPIATSTPNPDLDFGVGDSISKVFYDCINHQFYIGGLFINTGVTTLGAFARRDAGIPGPGSSWFPQHPGVAAGSDVDTFGIGAGAVRAIAVNGNGQPIVGGDFFNGTPKFIAISNGVNDPAGWQKIVSGVALGSDSFTFDTLEEAQIRVLKLLPEMRLMI